MLGTVGNGCGMAGSSQVSRGPITGLGLAGAALQMFWGDSVVSGHYTG